MVSGFLIFYSLGALLVVSLFYWVLTNLSALTWSQAYTRTAWLPVLPSLCVCVVPQSLYLGPLAVMISFITAYLCIPLVVLGIVLLIRAKMEQKSLGSLALVTVVSTFPMPLWLLFSEFRLAAFNYN